MKKYRIHSKKEHLINVQVLVVPNKFVFFNVFLFSRSLCVGFAQCRGDESCSSPLFGVCEAFCNTSQRRRIILVAAKAQQVRMNNLKLHSHLVSLCSWPLYVMSVLIAVCIL